MRKFVPGLVIGALILGSSAVAAQDAPEPVVGDTLAAVQARGVLICGVNGQLAGFSVLDEATGDFVGIDADYCRAVAQAVLGDASAVEFRPLTGSQRGPALQTGEIDVLIRNTTNTTSRDAAWGNFTQTIFYDRQGMMAPVDSGITTLADLEGATICVLAGTTTEQNLVDQMAVRGITYEALINEQTDAVYATYEEGRCDAVTSDQSQLAARRSGLADPSAHLLLEESISKEPLGPVVPHGDEQWYNIVTWVVNVTIEAEELGITSANVQDALASDDPITQRLLGVTGDVGSQLGLANDWVVGVIGNVGNYAEIYDRHLGPDSAIPLERGLNSLWLDGGLLYSPPYK